MSTPEGQVVAVGRQSVTVSVDAAAVCQRCAAGRGCGAGLFGKRQPATLLDVNVGEGVALRVGDRVRLELLPAHLLRAAWLVYGLPLFSMLLAVAAGSSLLAPGSDLAAVLSGAAGLVAGVLLGRRAINRSGCLRQCIPTASAIVRFSNTDQLQS
jgi:sigma-E factor negative regulatory protein RseC